MSFLHPILQNLIEQEQDREPYQWQPYSEEEEKDGVVKIVIGVIAFIVSVCFRYAHRERVEDMYRDRERYDW